MVKIPRLADMPDFPTLDEGWYELEIIKVNEEKEDKNGDIFISIEFTVAGANTKAWDVFYPQRQDRVWKLKNFVKQIDENLCDVEFNARKELLGKKVVAHILAPQNEGGLPRIREYVSIDRMNEADLKKEEDDLPF